MWREVKRLAKPEEWHTERELTEDHRGLVVDRIVIKPEADEFTILFTRPESGRSVSLAFFVEEDGTLGYAEGSPD